MSRISVVIRCLNEAKYIEKLLVGLTKQSVTDYEIVVVDSGSTDGTIEIVEKYNVKLVRIKPSDFSFGYSLNVGCAAATGDYLLFASAHVYPVYNNWLEKMAIHFKDEKVGLVYGKQIGNELTRYSEERIFHKWFPDESDLDQNHPFCNNANTMIRKSLWEQYKYDETLTGLEDMDWGRTILKEGYKIVYDADSSIVHVHEETSKQIFNRYRREAIAHHNIFPDQSFSFFDFLKLTTVNIISDYYHAIHDRKFLANLFDIPLFRFLQFYSTFEGYKHKGPVSSKMKKKFYYPNKLIKSTQEIKQESNKINYD